MPYHYGNNEYKHLIGIKIGDFIIKNIEYKPDNEYLINDGYTGKPYILILCNEQTFQFRQFQEVINKFCSLK